MYRFLSCLFFLFLNSTLLAQVSSFYNISFDNAVHHEAHITATFKNLKADDLVFRMSRTSPGRYALHEFMKNIYDVKVTDGNGNVLEVSRPDPYSWKVKKHNGILHVTYTLFANRGDGTYSQIDETHAHINIPATFIYMPRLEYKGIEVTFNVREDLEWKVATQLKHVKDHTFYAKNLQYFMDSPTEISNHSIRSFEVNGQIIKFVLHHNGTEEELDIYFEKVKKIVLQQEAVFGELPTFDYNTYSFLACYIPNASRDGMEHRNSTILTHTTSLADGGLDTNIGTVSHEFFHCWNVERIRPKALEPFKFNKTNMSGDLWFAEGFTSYYTSLILCRAGLITPEAYIKSLNNTFNYVWNSPARKFFNPIEMSYQAPFVDAARSVDPVNRENTFISYYSYGSALGLALDLSLREKGLHLDGFMQLMWANYGKQEKPYSVKDIQHTLNTYANEDFGNYFFDRFIYNSDMPNMEQLLNSVGVSLTQDKTKIDFGASVVKGMISNNTKIGTAAYIAGLENGDKLVKVNDITIKATTDFDALLNKFKPHDELTVVFERYGQTKTTNVILQESSLYNLSLFESKDIPLDDKQKTLREAWLASK